MKFNRQNLKIPQYLEKIIKLFPHISSGRKNYKDQHIRILKNIDIVKKFIKKNKNVNCVIADHWKSLELINAIYESIETGKEISLRFSPKFSKLGVL